MVSWGWLIVVFIFGECFGIFTAALCNIARDNNKES